jgi:hypothetical protein
MAKRIRAPARRATTLARRARKPLPSRSVPAHRTYSPQLLANGRRRFEQTDESVASIAADFGIHHYSLIRLAKREGWLRHARPQRDLPLAARLLAQAEALEAEALTVPAPDSAAVGEAAAPVVDVATIERLQKAVLAELATVEAMRAQLGPLPRRPLEAERTARTLSSLTETLQKLQRLRCALPPAGSADDDDLPTDIDAFRDDLARRIAAFMESRPDDGDAAEAPAASMDEA